jgi:hypothetical protein
MKQKALTNAPLWKVERNHASAKVRARPLMTTKLKQYLYTLSTFLVFGRKKHVFGFLVTFTLLNLCNLL